MYDLEKYGFNNFLYFKEDNENNAALSSPHIVSADPPLKFPKSIERISEAFKKSKEVAIGKEVDSKAGGEKNVTMKSKKLFIVGGAVRDYLLGHTPSNYDLATDAHPDEVERIMMDAKPPIQVVKKDSKKGVVRVSVDGENYDIETMKLPSKNNDTIFTTNMQDDTKRRDVTINSLYYEPSSNKIYDYTGGLRHLKDGNVKFIGKASDRIQEDGMRKYRYARMINKIPGAKIDDETKEAIGKHSDDLPPEKIRDEFWRGMEDLHTNPIRYIKTYNELGLLKTVFPGLELSMDFPDCKTCKTRPVLLAALLKNNKPPKLVEKLRELKYSDREIKDAVFLVNLLLFKPEFVYDFKRELLRTSLTKRQILDWAKINNLDVEMIEKFLNHRFSRHEDNGLRGEELNNFIKHMEAQSFMRAMKS